MNAKHRSGANPSEKKACHSQAFTLKSRLREIVNQHKTGSVRLNKIVSHETQDAREKVLFLGFGQLKSIGYHLHDPMNFKPKHMKALATYWENQGLSPSTIQNRISVFRVFCNWIGKGDMVGDSTQYVNDPASVKRTYAAQQDKSWSANGIDIWEMVERVEKVDPRVAFFILIAASFGMRLRETYMLKPYRADKDRYISLAEGTKGDRARTVPIETEEQKAVIEAAKELANGVNGHIGFPGKTLKQTKKRVEYILAKCGITKKENNITFHGLRHQFLNDFYERRAGVPSPVRGGPKVSGEIDELARLQTSEVAGHSRKSITSAYLGGILRSIRNQQEEGEHEHGRWPTMQLEKNQ